MAYDKIIPIRARLDHTVNYILDHAKTSLAATLDYIGDSAKNTLGQEVLETAINCQLETVFQDMLATKRRWDKTGGVQGYHLIHSFAPGEVTPLEAHELGVEFATRLLGDRYEAVVSTHLDHDHLHCHILFNSVSFMDGRKFQNTFRDYFRDIRGVSNAISAERGLSVIQPESRGKDYSEWQAEKSGKATLRGLVRRDIDAAIARAFTYQTFWEQLEKLGYAVKRGPSVKHTAVRPPGGVRFIRLSSLGDGYTEEAIRERLARARSGHGPSTHTKTIHCPETAPLHAPGRSSASPSPAEAPGISGPVCPLPVPPGHPQAAVSQAPAPALQRPKGSHEAEPLRGPVPTPPSLPHRQRRPAPHAGGRVAGGDRRPDGPEKRAVPPEAAGTGGRR